MPSDQLLVFFDEFPTINAEALAMYINKADADENEDVVAELVPEQVREPDDETRELGLGDQPLRVGACLLTMGEFGMSIITHNVPAPDVSCVDHSRLRPEIKERLKQHRAFALLTLTGGESYAPIERVIFLYKAAMGLCQQGGLGVGCPEGHSAIQCELLERMIETSKQHESTLWKSLRVDHVPLELFTNTSIIEEADQRWVVTFGQNMLRLPDLAMRMQDEDDPESIATLMRNVTLYMLDGKYPIQAGQQIKAEQGVYVFSDPPEDKLFLRRDLGLLVMERV